MKHTIYAKKILFLFLLAFSCVSARFDVNIVGLLGIETTAPLIGTSIMSAIKNDLSINLIASRKLKRGVVQTQFIEDLPFSPDDIAINHPELAPISLLTDVIAYKDQKIFKSVPETKIKLAYTMFEASKLPSNWVTAINSTFDAVIVPDEELVPVYENSGVKIPVFVIPLPILIEDMLTVPAKVKKDTPFIFAVSAGFSERKNLILLVSSFARVFGNNKNVKLKIHGSWGDDTAVRKRIADLGLTNVDVIKKKLTRQQYIDFIAGSHCYIFLSMGEGYSITPKDALALGIPVILSDHTVHKQMCKMPSVLPVRTRYLQKAYFAEMAELCGYFNQCSINDVCSAMQTMYSKHAMYQAKVSVGKEWVQQFTPKNLGPSFVQLLKPEKVILGNKNKIGKTLMTTSQSLYNKYNELLIENEKGKEKDE